MVEIQTGGDQLLRRFRDICGELARGERSFCDFLRELPAEGRWVSAFRAHLVLGGGQKVLEVVPSVDFETAEVDWRNTKEGWQSVCGRIDLLLNDPSPGICVSLCENEDWTDGFLSVER